MHPYNEGNPCFGQWMSKIEKWENFAYFYGISSVAFYNSYLPVKQHLPPVWSCIILAAKNP